MLTDVKIGIIGLGYVGLPLAVEFGKHFPTIGYDINQHRIDTLITGIDYTLEMDEQEISTSTYLTFTSTINDIKQCNIYIITVPTPIDNHKQPNLTPLQQASQSISSLLNINDIVIYESTVYPGCTEEICIPILEQYSGLTFNQDFFVGYSPERINPGDKQHRVTNILKITSGSTPTIADKIDLLYNTIITAGTHKASSIKIAEAAKIIENTQRDVNIALINELTIICNKLNIDTEEVLIAAGTKWNFLPFRPGLVGGHCIGVDPYYLTHKSLSLGYNPEVILSGRRINDGMGIYITSQLVKLMMKKRIQVVDSNILILGMTFKENCPDIRNTKVVDVIHELKTYNANVDVYDPWVNPIEAKQEYNISLINTLPTNKYNAIILAVAHDEFKQMNISDIRKLGTDNVVIYDLKYLFPINQTDARL